MRLVLHMEKELLKIATSQHFNGIFTINTNQLNQVRKLSKTFIRCKSFLQESDKRSLLLSLNLIKYIWILKLKLFFVDVFGKIDYTFWRFG